MYIIDLFYAFKYEQVNHSILMFEPTKNKTLRREQDTTDSYQCYIGGAVK